MIAFPVALKSITVADPGWLGGLKSASGPIFIVLAGEAASGIQKAYGDKEAFRFVTRSLLLVAVFAAVFFLARGGV